MVPDDPARLVLDPFAFPSETHGRSALLMVATVTLAASLGVLVTAPQLQEMLMRVLRSAVAATPPGAGVDESVDPILETERNRQASRMIADSLPEMALPLLIPTLGLGLLWPIAWLHYRSHPHRLTRRLGSRPLELGEAPTAVTALRSIARKVGLTPRLRLECKPGVLSFDGQAFGLRGREVLVLPQDPRLLEAGWSTTSRAIALHELAHLANGDTWAREGARALWFALTLLIALFLALSAISQPPLLLFLGFVLRCMGLLLVVRLIWRGLIRTRELYADWRAASWGAREALLRRLELAEPQTARSSPAPGTGEGQATKLGFLLRRWVRWWARFWRLHPSNAIRREALIQPLRLFEISPDLPFLTGVLLSLTAVSGTIALLPGLFVLTALAEWLYQGLLALADQLPETMRSTGYLAAALSARMLLPAGLVTLTLGGVTLLLTRALGAQVQRSAFAELAESKVRSWGYLRLLRPAALFALGLEIGLILVPWLSPSFLYPRPLISLLWIVAFTTLMWLWLAFVHAASRLLLGTHNGREVPIWVQRLILISATGLLTLLYWPMVWGRMTLHAADVVDRIPRELFPDLDPERFFLVMCLGMTFVLVLLTAVVYLVGFGLLLVAAVVRLMLLKTRCPLCGEPGQPHRAVSHSCQGCGHPLALWAYTLPEEAGL